MAVLPIASRHDQGHGNGDGVGKPQNDDQHGQPGWHSQQLFQAEQDEGNVPGVEQEVGEAPEQGLAGRPAGKGEPVPGQEQRGDDEAGKAVYVEDGRQVALPAEQAERMSTP